MESFFEFISEYFFLVILIVTGLIGYFNKQKGQDSSEHDESSDSTGQKQAKKSTLDETMKRVKDIVEKIETSLEEPKPVKKTTYQTERTRNEKDNVEQLKEHIPSYMEERHQQYEVLKNQYESSSYRDYDFSDVSFLEENQKSVGNQIDVEVSLDKKLSTKGLIESVIMAEVLGPPRAKKPYERFGHKR